MPDRRTVAAVFVGGAVGTLARAALSTAFPLPVGQWPWPTFLVNVVGAADVDRWWQATRASFTMDDEERTDSAE